MATWTRAQLDNRAALKKRMWPKGKMGAAGGTNAPPKRNEWDVADALGEPVENIQRRICDKEEW